MDRQRVPLKVTGVRFVRSIRNFASSDVGGKAKFLSAGLFALLCGLAGLNVVNSFVGRNFMSAIADRQTAEFVRQAMLYLGVFAALTIVGVLARFAEERLALPWREFITRRVVTLYLADETYCRLDASGSLPIPTSG
jgi:putative ATP-binding cassette transporter